MSKIKISKNQKYLKQNHKPPPNIYNFHHISHQKKNRPHLRNNRRPLPSRLQPRLPKVRKGDAWGYAEVGFYFCFGWCLKFWGKCFEFCFNKFQIRTKSFSIISYFIFCFCPGAGGLGFCCRAYRGASWMWLGRWGVFFLVVVYILTSTITKKNNRKNLFLFFIIQVFSLANLPPQQETTLREEYDGVPRCEWVKRGDVPTVEMPVVLFWVVFEKKNIFKNLFILKNAHHIHILPPIPPRNPSPPNPKPKPTQTQLIPPPRNSPNPSPQPPAFPPQRRTFLARKSLKGLATLRGGGVIGLCRRSWTWGVLGGRWVLVFRYIKIQFCCAILTHSAKTNTNKICFQAPSALASAPVFAGSNEIGVGRGVGVFCFGGGFCFRLIWFWLFGRLISKKI